MGRRAAKHAIVGAPVGWQTVAMRGVVVPVVVLGLVVGAAQTIAPGTPALQSVTPEPGFSDPAARSDSAAVRDESGHDAGTTSGESPAPAGTGESAAAWAKRISSIARGKSIGIAVSLEDDVLYEHNARGRRVPASNEKLLLSLALFDLLGADMRIATQAAARKIEGRVVKGDLYVLGAGDPTITGGGRFGSSLPIRPTRLKRLARHIKAAGIRRIRGRVVGSTNYFARDWFAPGWRPDFPSRYIALPTALTFDGNSHRGIHVADPERRAAASLTKKLQAIGVSVGGPPAAGSPSHGLAPVAEVHSEPLGVLARFMNRTSSNFFAEVLGKRLGAERRGRPGTIAKGAAVIRAWARNHGVEVTSKDASGLSYRNRVSPRGLSRLLVAAQTEKWWHRLRSALPTGGEGTLENRLGGVQVRAKTGTLEGLSALSGWVWLERRDAWAAFSMLSAGLPKFRATTIEDKIVRILESRAR